MCVQASDCLKGYCLLPNFAQPLPRRAVLLQGTEACMTTLLVSSRVGSLGRLLEPQGLKVYIYVAAAKQLTPTSAGAAHQLQPQVLKRQPKNNFKTRLCSRIVVYQVTRVHSNSYSNSCLSPTAKPIGYCCIGCSPFALVLPASIASNSVCLITCLSWLHPAVANASASFVWLLLQLPDITIWVTYTGTRAHQNRDQLGEIII